MDKMTVTYEDIQPAGRQKWNENRDQLISTKKIKKIHC